MLDGHGSYCFCPLCRGSRDLQATEFGNSITHASSDPFKTPDLTPNFPYSVPDLKINNDLDNLKHGPHFDIITGISGGIEKTRIDPFGNPIGGDTQIGPIRMPWDKL